MVISNEVSNYFILWQDELDAEGHNYSPRWAEYRSPAAIALLKKRVSESGSLPSISGYILAFQALVAEGLLKPIRVARPVEPQQHDLTAAEYHATPANQIIRRYRSDNDYKAQVDALIQKGLIALLMGISLSGVFHL